MGVATSLVTGWCAGRLTRNPVGFLTGYLLSLACLGRTQFSNAILSETLFTLTLALHLAAIILWTERQDSLTALGVGLSLGLSILVRPVAQALWLPELVLLVLRVGGARRTLGERSRQGGLFALAVLASVSPWLARNQLVFGQAFLTRSLGRHLWVSTFASGGAALPLPEGQPAEWMRGVDFREEWAVDGTLEWHGLAELERDDWMISVSRRAIGMHPWAFARSVAYNGLRYWWTVTEGLPWYIRTDRSEPDQYLGQHAWAAPWLVAPLERPLRFVYRYSRTGAATAGALALLGALTLALRAETRLAGVALTLLLAYFAVVVAAFQQPLFRYRSVVEPVMIVAIVAGLFSFLRHGSGLRDLSSDEPSSPAGGWA
jgi:hypothetical protein